jgi:hypothetical protein
MKPTIRIDAAGVPYWNDDRGGVHNPTQFRSALEAQHVPIANITFKQMKDSFEIEGDPRTYAPGDFFCMIDGRPVGLTAAEFAAAWEPTGAVAH